MLGLNWTKEDVFNVPVLFSDILRIDTGSTMYEELQDRGKIIKNLEEKLDDYNLSSNDKMNLVFFDDAMEHIVRVCRVLRQPRYGPTVLQSRLILLINCLAAPEET